MKKASACLFTYIYMTLEVLAQSSNGFFYDPRDGQEYETVFIELETKDGIKSTQEWMTTNLNYDAEGSYCYKNYVEYCNSFGKLYSWKAAMSACPEGWHMSQNVEWELLAKKYGGLANSGPSLKEGGESRLNLQVAGFGEQNGAYIDVGVNGYYWKRASRNSTNPGSITIHRGVQYITDDEVDATHRNSIRCVRDY